MWCGVDIGVVWCGCEVWVCGVDVVWCWCGHVGVVWVVWVLVGW